MKITKEIINILCLAHQRTSCSDENPCNAFGGWYGKYNRNTGKKEIRYPRCVRCYLIDNIGADLENLEWGISVTLYHKGKE